MTTAAAINIEIVADLAPFDASLRRAEGNATRSANVMAGSLSRVEGATDRVNASGARAVTATQRLAATYDNATTATARLAAANDNAARSMDRMNGVMANGAGRITAYTGALSGVALGAAVAAAGLAAAASAIARAGDEFTGYRNKLLTAGEDQGTLNKRLSELTDIALRSRTGLQPVIDLYSGISKSTQEMGKSQAEAARVTETISKAFSASGTSAASAAGAILQLNQAFASGTLRGDELNSVMEGAPVLARLIAKEFGIAVGELKSFGEEGKLSADRVFNAFLSGSKEVDSTFNATATTISQASTNAGTALSQLGNDLNNLVGLAQGAVAALNAVAGAVQGISARIQAFQTGVQQARIDNLKNTIDGLEQTEIPFLSSTRDTKGVKEATESLARFRAEYDKLVTARIDSAVTKPPQILLNTEGMVTTARATRTAAKALEELDKVEKQVARDGMGAVEKATLDANKAFEERAKVAKQMRADGVENAKIADFETRSQKILTEQIKQANEAAAKKGGGGRSSSSGSSAIDGFDSAVKRYEDETAALKLQQDQASRTGEELYKLQATQRLQQAALKAGRSGEEGLAASIEATASAYAKQRVATDAAIEAQKKYQESVKFTADLLTSFVEDVLTGSLESALKSLGKSFLSASLDALISGKGPLAGITGLAANDNKSQGGIIGALLGLPKAVENGSRKGTQAGSIDGVVTGIDIANKGGTGGLFGIDGKQLAGGLTAIASLAGAYGAGMSAGSYGQAGISGGISGAMGGAALATSLGLSGMMSMALPGIGLALGAGLAVYGQQQARKQAKEARQQEAENNYKQAQPDIVKLGSQLRGDAQGTLLQQFEEATAATRKLGDIAFFAGKYDEQAKLWADLATYKTRIYTDFAASYQGFVDALNMGVGPGGAFNTAKDSVKALGDQLKVFAANTDEVYGAGSAAAVQARQAAASYALSTLVGSKELSTVATRMEEIRGVGAGLTQVLKDLGMSAEDAAAAIQDATTVALSRLKETFESDLLRRTSEAQGYGYVNEVSDLLKEFATLQQDAAALGTDPALVANYFRAAAQEIVDGAQLTGSAFDDLIRQFPELNGYVEEFTGALKGAAREADIAARKLAYADRLFNATNDNSTLEGQLAAYNRQALREREEEIKKGGEALVDLEMAQAAERFNIIRDWNQKALDDQKRAAEEARSFWQRFAKQIREYTDGLRAGSESPLSPQARLAAAQSQYNAQLALAQGGDRDALSGITSYSSDLLDAAKAYYASSTGYQDIFASVIAQLEALPDQVSETQLIIDAIDAGAQATVDAVALMSTTLKTAVDSGSAAQIATALSTYFNKIDTNTSDSIDFNEMKSALSGMASDSALRSMFTRLDVDNSGSLDRLELLKTATEDVDDRLTITNQLTADLKALTTQVNTNVNASNNILSAVQSLNAAINSSTASAATSLAFQNASTTYILSMRDMMRVQNSNWGAQNQLGFSIPTYAQGGLVSGPGTGTSDSITARLSNGEFVMREAAARQFADLLPYMNDNLRLPPIPMGVVPAPVASGREGNAALIAEVRELRAELKALREETRKGAALVGEEVASVNASVRAGNGVAADNNKRLRRVGAKAA